MTLSLLIVQLLNGLQFGVLLFLVAAGLTLVFGVMDFINLAHGVQYMLGAYLAVTFVGLTGSFLLGLILALAAAHEVPSIGVTGDRDDRPGDGHPGFKAVVVAGPLLAERLDLTALLDMERLTRLVRLEGGGHQVHALLGCPPCRRVGPSTPPDPFTEPFRIRLESQESGWIGEHRPRIGLRELLSRESLEEHLGVPPRHVGIGLAFGRLVTEVPPPVDHLFRRPPGDTQLESAARDEVGGCHVLGEAQRRRPSWSSRSRITCTR